MSSPNTNTPITSRLSLGLVCFLMSIGCFPGEMAGGYGETGATETGARELMPDDGHPIDFLFVIDNSGSMANRAALAASLPSFVDSIEDTEDFHIMVTDTDAWVHSACPSVCGAPHNLPSSSCVGYECGVTVPSPCEDILGAGVTHPRGYLASNMDCGLQAGQRFLTDAHPDLAAAFECAATVGAGSTDLPERQMGAMVQAVSGLDCNAGFLRDDAALVVTFITDGSDGYDGSAGTPDSWRAALLEAKHGDESSIVVLGLFGDDDLATGFCSGLADPSPMLRVFLNSWGDRGVFGSVCSDSFGEFFQAAVELA